MGKFGAFLIFVSFCLLVMPFGNSPDQIEFLIITGVVTLILGAGFCYFGFSKRSENVIIKNGVSENKMTAMEEFGVLLIFISICFFIITSSGRISPAWGESLIGSGVLAFILGLGIYYYEFNKRTKQEVKNSDVLVKSNSRLLKCIDCGKDVSSRAKACPHCGAPLMISDEERVETLGVVMLVIPICSSFLVWFWIAYMPLIEGPGSKLNFLVVLTIIVTAILAFVESNKIGIGKPLDSGKKINTPVEWFVLLLVFWIIAYPAYFWARSKYGLKNLLLASIIVAVIFTWSSVSIGLAINQQAQKVQDYLNQATQQLQGL